MGTMGTMGIYGDLWAFKVANIVPEAMLFVVRCVCLTHIPLTTFTALANVQGVIPEKDFRELHSC